MMPSGRPGRCGGSDTGPVTRRFAGLTAAAGTGCPRRTGEERPARLNDTAPRPSCASSPAPRRETLGLRCGTGGENYRQRERGRRDGGRAAETLQSLIMPSMNWFIFMTVERVRAVRPGA